MHRYLLTLFLLLPLSLEAFWPVFYEFGEEKRIFGPLVSFSKKEGKKEKIIRPLFLIHEEKALMFPYPLAKFSPDKSYFIPFYSATKEIDRSYFSLFLLFYGREGDETFFGIFPFYGEMKNRFGRDRIGFFLWPIYGVSEIKGKKKENFIWPFFSLYSGKETGYKVFPLYGVREIEGVKKSRFFLWPLIYLEKKDMDTEDPYYSFYFLPFYLSGRNESRSVESYCVLFPLYCYFKNREGTKESILWPFITKSDGKEVGISIFPFFKHLVTEEYEIEGILWPFLYTKKESFFEGEEEIDVRFLILNRYAKKGEETFFNVWPLFGYEEKKNTKSFSLPFLFPFRFERIQSLINPLFSIVEYKRKDDWRGLNILYGLYTDERKGENWKKRFAFLLEAKKEEGRTLIEILSGLFAIEESKMRVFFVPIRRGQRGTQNVP